MKKCKYCDNELQNIRNTFCNSSCSAKYNNARRPKRSEESRLKTSNSVRKTMGLEQVSKLKNKPTPNPLIQATKNNRPYTAVRQCTFCKKFFNYDQRKSTSCSDKCYIDIKIKLNRNGKKCDYKGIAMDSLWEKRLAIYLDSKNIKWVRPNYSLLWVDVTGKNRKYFPDFYLVDYDLYLDPKNKYCQKSQQEKLEYLKAHYPNIIIGTLEEIMAYLKGVEPSCNPITLSTGS